MASPNHIISSDYTFPANNEDVLVIARPSLTRTASLFFPYNHYYYFSAPPFYYFFSDTNLLPPSPSIFVFYPLWSINPNPNRFESIQEPLPLYSPNPSQELSPPPTTNGSNEGSLCSKKVFGRKDNKVTWRIKHEDESNGGRITTVMLRNIPNKYTREMMIEVLDKHCEEANKKEKDEGFPISAYDFLYLPVDFRSGLNKGYAFVNFTNAEAVKRFKVACNHKPWSHFCSRKGKDDLVKHFEQMTYPVEAYSAVCFSPARSGPKNTVQTIMVGKCAESIFSV
ncbi:unnamed protein product [Arabis nemorensis]|uniref:Mei2-like C-terminal RNA recognition motif domain-containing protein n=1 Tax=Arabis nemorensis TaxID=586526 RepID=A0A565CJB6_9BRAS|nr:unnamed protein product [Arabis nemorensis]